MKHRQKSDYVSEEGKTYPGEWLEFEFPDPEPFVETKSPVQKTKPDADGWRPMTNYSAARGTTFSRVDYSGVFAVLERHNGYHFVITTENPLPFEIPMSSTSLPSLANVKNAALNKIKGQQLNVVMLLKDRKETLNGIHDRLKWLLTSVNAARKGNLVKSAQSLKRFWRSRTPGVVNRYKALNDKVGKPVANMWLELNFLHMQVISDANGLIKELGAEPNLGFLHGRSGIVKEVEDLVDDQGRYTWNYWGNFRFNRIQKDVVYAQVSAKPDLEFLTSASRLGITNMPYVLWDSVPLSFVADWVIPVGSYLNAWDALLGMEFKGAHVGIVRSQTVTFRGHTFAEGEVLKTGTVSIQNPRTFERRLTDWTPDMPEVRNPLTGLAWKVATTAALLSGAVSKSQSKLR